LKDVYLDIPTYFDKDFINFIQKVNEDKLTIYGIKHVYGSDSGSFSARETERLPIVKNLQEHIKELSEINVDFFYTLNASCLGSLKENDVIDIETFINKLYNIGVKNFIISHPYLIRIINKINKLIKIKISTIMEINDIQRINYYFKKAEIITLSTSANRNFRLLENIKNRNVEIMINECCLYMCPFRASHYSIESHRENSENTFDNYPLDECYSLLNKNEIIMSRYVLPEWIEDYSKFSKYFKISGRTFPRKFIENATLYYSRGISPENVLDLFPIVTGSIKNEQTGKIEKRHLSFNKEEIKEIISYFKIFGHFCNTRCPCGFCEKYSKNVTSRWENDRKI